MLGRGWAAWERLAALRLAASCCGGRHPAVAIWQVSAPGNAAAGANGLALQALLPREQQMRGRSPKPLSSEHHLALTGGADHRWEGAAAQQAPRSAERPPSGASSGPLARMLRQLGRLAPRLTGTLELSAAAGLHTSAATQGVGIPERRHPLGTHSYPGRFEGEPYTPAGALQAGSGSRRPSRRCCPPPLPRLRPPAGPLAAPHCAVPQACSAAAVT